MPEKEPTQPKIDEKTQHRLSDIDAELFEFKKKAKGDAKANLKLAEMERAKELILEKRGLLGEKLNSLEIIFSTKEQCQGQKEILTKTGILERLSTNELGIKAIDNKEYPFPTYQEITKTMRANKEVLKTKAEQGFTKMLIVPFGLKLDNLIDKYKQVILKHHQDNKLLATKKDSQDPDQQLKLDENEPVWVWDQYQNADTENKLVYFPQQFSQDNHQGKTKLKILEEQGAWQIVFIEDLPNIPRANQGQTIKDRKQLEANQTPQKYLTKLQTGKNYQSEQGLTPEDQLIYAITHLEQTNQVIDDYQGHGSASYQLGAYFTDSGDVPTAYWGRGSRQAYLYGYYGPSRRDTDSGVRSSVRVKNS